MVGDDDVIRGPAGDGRVSAVAIDDVADVAAAVLLDPAAHAGQAYGLTGPQAYSLAEVAQTLRELTGRPVSYHDETLAEAFASRASYGAPDWMVQAWVSTYTAIAAGEVAAVTDDVPRITGHPATSLRRVLTTTRALGLT
jgi:NAD(P)H dehydrogenase (quinone)